MPTITAQTAGQIATVTIANRGKRNALDARMWTELAHAMAELSADQTLRCVIVRGDGEDFSAGADIDEFSTVRSTLEQGMRYHTEFVTGALQAITDCLHPTIAAIEGVCIGGGLEIACACDIRIAATNGRFGIPINRLGFPMAPSELQSLLQLVGKAATLEILLEGRVFSAEEAQKKGLLTRVEKDVHAEVQASAERIASGAPLAARMNKQLVKRMTPAPQALSEQEQLAAFAFLDSQDYREGVQSFLDKRPPVFTGR